MRQSLRNPGNLALTPSVGHPCQGESLAVQQLPPVAERAAAPVCSRCETSHRRVRSPWPQLLLPSLPATQAQVVALPLAGGTQGTGGFAVEAHLSGGGRRRLGPFDVRAHAVSIATILRAKAAQEAGAADWEADLDFLPQHFVDGMREAECGELLDELTPKHVEQAATGSEPAAGAQHTQQAQQALEDEVEQAMPGLGKWQQPSDGLDEAEQQQQQGAEQLAPPAEAAARSGSTMPQPAAAAAAAASAAEPLSPLATGRDRKGPLARCPSMGWAKTHGTAITQ